MLGQWSKQVIEAWIGPYTKLLPILARKDNGAQEQHYLQKGINVVQTMASRSESLAVRTSNTLLVGAIADSNSLLTVANFEQHMLPIVKSLC